MASLQIICNFIGYFDGSQFKTILGVERLCLKSRFDLRSFCLRSIPRSHRRFHITPSSQTLILKAESSVKLEDEDSANLLRMSGTVAVELSSSSLHSRQLGITGDGLETSHALSMKMICTNKQRLQKTVGRLEKMQGPMKKQRDDLLFLVATMEEWSLIMHESERGHSGVPVLRSVKEGCNEIRPSLNSNNSQLNQTVQQLSKASVPRIAHVQKCLKDLRKEIRAVFDDENTYNGKFVEDVRETIGNIIGTSNALIALYYS